VNEAVPRGDVILSIPIASCFRDDEPPDWFARFTEDDDVTDYERYDPSAWAIRLAASLLDMDLDRDDANTQGVKRGRILWKSLLPDKDILRASLPVHWSEELLLSTKCTALEVAVDNAFFSRGNAVMSISDKLCQFLNDKEGFDEEELKQKCHDALDMVRLSKSSILCFRILPFLSLYCFADVSLTSRFKQEHAELNVHVKMGFNGVLHYEYLLPYLTLSIMPQQRVPENLLPTLNSVLKARPWAIYMMQN
jgi:hypothetical protein